CRGSLSWSTTAAATIRPMSSDATLDAFLYGSSVRRYRVYPMLVIVGSPRQEEITSAGPMMTCDWIPIGSLLMRRRFAGPRKRPYSAVEFCLLWKARRLHGSRKPWIAGRLQRSSPRGILETTSRL